jgi:RimJ/RimL family protein N-acetyltransferase
VADVPVILSRIGLADWRAVHSWACLPQVCRFQTWGPNTEEQTRAFEANRTYAVHPRVWGRGVGTAIGKALLVQGFEDLGLHRVYATCDPRNLGSARILRKLGMTWEGRHRHTALIRDGWRDSEVFGVLEDEWRTLASRPPHA